MKRVLCILSSLDAGGAETFVMKMNRNISSEGYCFDFVVSKENGCYTKEVLNLGGKIFFVPARRDNFLKAFVGIKRIVKENKYKYILKLGEDSLAFVDLLAAKMGGAKVLILRSCNAPTGKKYISRIIHRSLRPFVNMISTVKIAPSRLAANYMFGERENVNILHNGLDLNAYYYDEQGRNKIRKEFGIEDKLVVGHIGRFFNQKNHKFLIEIFAEIVKQRDDAILLLVGIGDLINQVKNQVDELNLSDKVIFTGRRFDIPELLSSMDVFVFPSFYEGMPNTVIEAQAAGLPCVISDTITQEANITGLVEFLSLTSSAKTWSNIALKMAKPLRENSHIHFIENGYDIESVTKSFISLLK